MYTNTLKIYGNKAAKQLSAFLVFQHLNKLHNMANAFMHVHDQKHGHIKSSENLTRAVVA